MLNANYSEYQVFSILSYFHLNFGRLELPQWMVEGLNSGRTPYLDVEVLIRFIFQIFSFSGC